MFIFFIIESTEENLSKLRNREPEIFHELYISYKDKIYNFLIIKTGGDRHLSEDILCETYLSAMKAAPQIKNLNNISGWLYQIAFRRLNDHLRKKYREDKYIKNSDQEVHFADNSDDFIKKEKALILNNAMDNIKPDYKKIIQMKYIDKKTIEEISCELSKSTDSIKSLLIRAKDSLKKEMNKSDKLFNG